MSWLNAHFYEGPSTFDGYLCGTARNLEFQFAGRDAIAIATKKYNESRALERNKQKEIVKIARSPFCKVHSNVSDIQDAVKKDVDVNTALSMECWLSQQKKLVDELDRSKAELNLNEDITQDICTAKTGRLCGGADTQRKANDYQRLVKLEHAVTAKLAALVEAEKERAKLAKKQVVALNGNKPTAKAAKSKKQQQPQQEVLKKQSKLAKQQRRTKEDASTVNVLYKTKRSKAGLSPEPKTAKPKKQHRAVRLNSSPVGQHNEENTLAKPNAHRGKGQKPIARSSPVGQANENNMHTEPHQGKQHKRSAPSSPVGQANENNMHTEPHQGKRHKRSARLSPVGQPTEENMHTEPNAHHGKPQKRSTRYANQYEEGSPVRATTSGANVEQVCNEHCSRKSHQQAVSSPRQAGGAHLDGKKMIQVCYEHYPQQQQEWPEVMHPNVMSQSIKVNVCDALNATPMAAHQFMQQNYSEEPDSMTPFFVDDSDLDHELENRDSYLRYCPIRPNRVDSDDNNELQQVPCFVEIERDPSKVQFLRSTKSMQFSSQPSDEMEQCTKKNTHKQHKPKRHISKSKYTSDMDSEATLVPTEERKPCKNKNMGKTSKDAKNVQQKTELKPHEAQQFLQIVRKIKESLDTESIQKRTDVATPSKKRPLTVPQIVQVPGGLAKVPDKISNASPSLPVSKMRKSMKSKATTPRQSGGECRQKAGKKHSKRKHRLLWSKSLEELKVQRLIMYNKLSSSQESIIILLDRLHNSLLQLEMPKYSSAEKERREESAFHFRVRFSRNFLFPLKVLIDDLRIEKDEEFFSAKSNTICKRVLNIYTLIQKSLRSFCRQLRYFLMDKVPRKLSALMEMVFTVTSLCLEKGMFDRQDPIVECLLQRCGDCLGFIGDLQRERFNISSIKSPKSKKQSKPSHVVGAPYIKLKTRSLLNRPVKVRKSRLPNKYDLKMCMNERNVYEAKLLPKEIPKEAKKRKIKKRTTGAQAIETTKEKSDKDKERETDKVKNMEKVQTQIERIKCIDVCSSGLSLRSLLSRRQPQAAAWNIHKQFNNIHAAKSTYTMASAYSNDGDTDTDTNTYYSNSSGHMSMDDDSNHKKSEECIANFLAQLNLPGRQTAKINQTMLQLLKNLPKEQIPGVIEAFRSSTTPLAAANTIPDNSEETVKNC